jgi:hypothetical protein
MRESREASIDGIAVTVKQLPAKRARNLLRRLLAVAAPAVTKALGGASEIADIDLAALSDAAVLLFDRLPESELDAIYGTLLEECTLSTGVQGATDFKIGTYAQMADDMLAGKLFTEAKIVRFALEVNYGDFLGAMKGSLAGLLAGKPKSPSPSV